MTQKNDTHPSLPRIKLPIVVEGRYDKSAVLSMFSATVITTEGFGIFNSKEKQALIRKISGGGIIILTDSDAGGKQIRSFISSIVPKDKIYNVYVPRIQGKEKRKAHASREGVLGVEGVGGEVLRQVLMPYVSGNAPLRHEISAPLLFELGLTGAGGSAFLRDRVLESLSLPPGMNAKAFAAAVDLLLSADELRALVEKIC